MSVVANCVASEVTGIKVETVARVGSELGMVGKGVFMVDVHNKEGEASVDGALGDMVVKIGDVVTGVADGVDDDILVDEVDAVTGVVDGVDGIDDDILADEVNVVTGILDGVDAIDDAVAIKVDDNILVDEVTGVVDGVDAIDDDILVDKADVVCGVAGEFGDTVADDSETDDPARLKQIATAGAKNFRKSTTNIV